MQYSLNDYKKSKLIVISLWLIYASAYFARTCYSTAITAIISDGVYTKSAMGLVGSAFFICYGCGQLFSGFIGDRVNPFKMVLAGAVMSAGCNFVMSAANSVELMAVIWGINGICQSMLWSPILRIFSEIINERLRRKAALNIALSLPVGTICSYAASTAIIDKLSWHAIFVCGGAVIMSLSILYGIIYAGVKASVSKSAPAAKDGAKHKSAKSGAKLMPLIMTSGLAVIIVPSLLHGMLRDGITNWVPTMLSETYSVTPSFSIMLTVMLPFFNAFGAYAVTPLYKKLGENEMKTAAVCAGLSLIPLCLLLLIGKIPIYAGVFLLALTTSSMYALNYLIITRVPMNFAGCSRTSTITGILNSFAYIGCAISGYGFGAVSEHFGWTATVLVWIGAVILIIVFTAFSIKQWSKFKKSA